MAKKITEYVSDRVFEGTRPIKGKRLENLKAKRAKELAKREKEEPKKKVAKGKFTVSVFTERGARSLKKIYEGAGYKFVSSKVTPDKVFLTFQDKE